MRAMALALVVLVACAGPSRPVEGPKVASPVVPLPVDPVPAGEGANLVLTREQRAPIELGATATLRYEGLVVESIAAGPSAAYPAGSGLSLTLVLEGGARAERQTVSLLSEGYTSRPVAWFGSHRVTLLDVKDPEREAKVELVVERVSDRARPGAPVVARVEVGQSITLDDGVRVEFLGNSTKEIGEGEAAPLLVALRYLVPGEEPRASESSVGSDGGPLGWTWRDYRFVIVEHAYAAWMKLSIERLVLDRAATGCAACRPR